MTYRYNGADALTRAAYDLKARNAPGCALPPLLFLTDPERTPDVIHDMAHLPPGNAVIYRHFGARGNKREAYALLQAAKSLGLFFLLGADPQLARQIGADGVHFAERQMNDVKAWRAKRPDWKISVAAHSAEALATATKSGADAALLSPVFPSQSPSAGKALGVEAFSSLVEQAGIATYALGGISELNVSELRESGAAGIAAVSAIRQIRF